MIHILIVIHGLALFAIATSASMRHISKGETVKFFAALFISAIANAWLIFLTGAQ